MKQNHAMVTLLQHHIQAIAGREVAHASVRDVWQATARTVVDLIAARWDQSTKVYSQGRRQHYLSAEFLVGRSLSNNLVNLGIYDAMKAALASLGKDLSVVLDEEYDAGLGNGGLGRLAAC